MHTIKCTICQGSFDSNKILFFKPIYISYIYLFGVYGFKNRYLNHKRMGKYGREEKKKLQKLRMVVLSHRGERGQARESER